MNRISRITRAMNSDWAPRIEATVRRAVPVVAAVITAAILTYEAGAWLRGTLSELNDSLAALWASVWGVATEEHAERVDELVLGALALVAVAWEWLVTEPETPIILATTATPLLPPPVRKPAEPKTDPLRRVKK